MSWGTVLITGGSGSFGRAFIRTVLQQDLAAKVISVSRNAEMRYRLEQECADSRVRVLPGDVRVLGDLLAAVEGETIDVLVHAAAEKHVVTGERHGRYVIDVNVRGASHVLALAHHCRPRVVVGLSTDKACEPVLLYGRTKQEAERLFVAAEQSADTRVVVTRYGNVLGSSGSVLPLFLKQRESGRLTVTDRRATRFFMPLVDQPSCDFQIREEGRPSVWSAVGLVRYAIDHGQHREILVPRIPSACIGDLAREVGLACEIVETGLRAGEKLHERLVGVEESARTVYEPGRSLFRIRPIPSGPAPAEFWAYESNGDPLPIRMEWAVPA